MTAVITDTAIVGAPVDRVDGPAKVTGAPASDQAFRAAAAAALRDPFTVDGTAFKVELAKRCIVRVLQDLAGAQP